MGHAMAHVSVESLAFPGVWFCLMTLRSLLQRSAPLKITIKSTAWFSQLTLGRLLLSFLTVSWKMELRRVPKWFLRPKLNQQFSRLAR